MTSEEEEYATVDFNYSIKLQEELDKNEEYKDLLLERKEILRSNGKYVIIRICQQLYFSDTLFS